MDPLTHLCKTAHYERSKAVADGILKRVPVRPSMEALDYGAGSGMLSYLLADKFSRITMMDHSEEMVTMMKEEVALRRLKNLYPVRFDMERSSYKERTFDCVITQMALHHIIDTALIFRRFYEILNPGGYLAIADLYTEDGSFHGDGFTGHCGFDPDVLAASLMETGFSGVVSEHCYTLSRERDSVTKEYPIFLLIAEKKK